MTRGPAHGFTLIEMVVVVTIVSVLALAAVPLQDRLARRVKEQALRSALRDIRSALDEHRRAVETRLVAAGEGGTPWPASLQRLVDGVPLVDESGRPREDARRLYLLRRLPRDPFAEPALSAADSWGQRASTSPPDAPLPGADVFDVHSRSESTALDGSRYRDW